jgi:hypothetical protein
MSIINIIFTRLSVQLLIAHGPLFQENGWPRNCNSTLINTLKVMGYKRNKKAIHLLLLLGSYGGGQFMLI